MLWPSVWSHTARYGVSNLHVSWSNYTHWPCLNHQILSLVKRHCKSCQLSHLPLPTIPILVQKSRGQLVIGIYMEPPGCVAPRPLGITYERDSDGSTAICPIHEYRTEQVTCVQDYEFQTTDWEDLGIKAVGWSSPAWIKPAGLWYPHLGMTGLWSIRGWGEL